MFSFFFQTLSKHYTGFPYPLDSPLLSLRPIQWMNLNALHAITPSFLYLASFGIFAYTLYSPHLLISFYPNFVFSIMIPLFLSNTF
jgi:hypothetical protein